MIRASGVILCFHLYFILLYGCGDDLANRFDMAAKKQDSLENQTMELWERGPATDYSYEALNIKENLEQVPRKLAVLKDMLDLNAPLESAYLRVFSSSSNETVPSFFKYAGQRISVNNPDFFIFNSYYHFTEAVHYASALFPSFDPGFVTMSESAGGVYRLYVDEPGNAFDTGYNYVTKAIRLYKQSSGEAEGFNAGHEADTIYHEFAHTLLHAINPALVVAPEAERRLGNYYYNPDLDAIQEGLADYFAAAMTRDDKILQYLELHAKFYANPKNRTGVHLFRYADNDVYFPDGYRNDIHLDGRVISAVFNDIRKFVSGESVVIYNGCDEGSSGSCVKEGSSSPVSEGLAFDETLKLAFTVFGDPNLDIYSTFQDYAIVLSEACSGYFASSLLLCTNFADIEADIREILLSRGLLSPHENLSDTQQNIDAGESGGNPLSLVAGTDPDFYPVYVSGTLGFLPFPDHASGLSNDNDTVEPCELILIYPNIENRSESQGMPASLYDIAVELGAVTNGLKAYVNPSNGSVTDEIPRGVPGSGPYPMKLLGWLEPGENVQAKLRDFGSNWYKDLGRSAFTQKLSSTHFPTGVGFLVQAPESLSVLNPPRAYMKIFYRAYNSRWLTMLSNDSPSVSSDSWFMADNLPLSLPVGDVNDKTLCAK
jgi:hypothetical protein